MPFTFPLWAIVNLRNRKEEGFPYFFMERGGPPTPLPCSLPFFTTRAIADMICSGEPFGVIEIDKDGFYEILAECREVEDVIIDMGTENATVYRVEKLLADMRGQ
jgi:hypothetical protein